MQVRPQHDSVIFEYSEIAAERSLVWFSKAVSKCIENCVEEADSKNLGRHCCIEIVDTYSDVGSQVIVDNAPPVVDGRNSLRGVNGAAKVFRPYWVRRTFEGHKGKSPPSVSSSRPRGEARR